MNVLFPVRKSNIMSCNIIKAQIYLSISTYLFISLYIYLPIFFFSLSLTMAGS